MERLIPNYHHDVVVLYDDEEGKIAICFKKPLDIIKPGSVTYPLRVNTANLFNQFTERVANFCTGILKQVSGIKQVDVEAYQISVRLAPLTPVDEVYGDVIDNIDCYLGFDKRGLYDLRARKRAEADVLLLKKQRSANEQSNNLKHWKPQWVPVYSLFSTTSITGQKIRGRIWMLRSYNWCKNGDSLIDHYGVRIHRRLYATTEEKENLESVNKKELEKRLKEHNEMLEKITHLEAFINSY